MAIGCIEQVMSSFELGLLITESSDLPSLITPDDIDKAHSINGQLEMHVEEKFDDLDHYRICNINSYAMQSAVRSVYNQIAQEVTEHIEEVNKIRANYMRSVES